MHLFNNTYIFHMFEHHRFYLILYNMFCLCSCSMVLIIINTIYLGYVFIRIRDPVHILRCMQGLFLQVYQFQVFIIIKSTYLQISCLLHKQKIFFVLQYI